MPARIAMVYRVLRILAPILLAAGLVGIIAWFPNGAAAVLVVIVWLFNVIEYVNYTPAGQRPQRKGEPMRMTIDRDADAAYIYLVDRVEPGEVSYTREADVQLDTGEMYIDFDHEGRILGIEILGASFVLRQSTLDAALDIGRG